MKAHTPSLAGRIRLLAATTLLLPLAPVAGWAQAVAPTPEPAGPPDARREAGVPAPPPAAERPRPTPSVAGDEAVELSPFVVGASRNIGYESSETLSGTRLRSASKFVAAAVTEFTDTIMQDLSLTNFGDLVDFAPNSSAYNGGGFDSDPNGNTGLFGVNYSVRGFLVTSVSRDFINIRSAEDAYNIEQFSFTRGPNAVLFGIGNPAGITNSVSKRAKFTNAYTVAFRGDTNGSTRATLDLNKVLLRNRLAVRVTALKENKETNRKPSDRAASRIYGALTARPFSNTTLRFSGEHGKIDALNVRPWPASDALTPWIRAGMKEVPAGLEAGGANYANLTSNPAGAPTAATNTAILKAAGFEIQNPSPLPMFVQNSAAPLPMLNQMGFITTDRRLITGGSIAPTLVESPIPYKANVLGYGNRLVQDLDNYTVTLEQRIGKDLYVEAVFNHQRDHELNDYSSSNTDQIYIEKQKTLLTMDNKIVANPNYGRYLTRHSMSTNYSDYVDRTARITASYSFDFREKAKGLLGTLLGHHNFAALGEKVTTDFVRDTAFLVNTSPQAVKSTPRFPAAAVASIQHSNNRLFTVSYITLGDASTYPNSDLLPRYPGPLFDGSPVPAVSSDGITPAWVMNTSVRQINELKSKMFVAQDYFWNDKVVTTFGARTDSQSLWALESANNTTNLSYTIDSRKRDVKGLVQELDRGGSTYTQGVVVTPVRWAALLYNRSSSVVPPTSAGIVDIYGDPIAVGNGKGQDYGLRFSLFGDKFQARVARYSTAYKKVPTTILRSGSTNMSTHRLAIITAMSRATGAAMWDGSDPRWADSTTVLYGINDLTSDGYEVSVTANPTRNWRITANFSHQTTKSSNFGAKEAQWLQEVAYGYFNAHPEYLGILTGAGLQNSNETIAQRLEDMKTVLSLAKSLSGKANARQPQYSGNLITGYDIVRGTLKGLGFGGSYKWRDKNIIGYPFVPGRTDLFNTNHAFYGEATNDLGAFVYYRLSKWGKKMKIQLNADGITNDEHLHPYSAVDAGNGTPIMDRYSVGKGRNFALTTTFDF
jgi:iron complex outermembrane receptor protein